MVFQQRNASHSRGFYLEWKGGAIMGKVRDERNRQIALGYTLEHDQQQGVCHLLYWAVRYSIVGKFIKGAALVVAAYEVMKARKSW